MKHFLILTRLQLRCLLSSLQVGRRDRRRAVSGWAALALISSAFWIQPNGESFWPSVPGIVTSHACEPSCLRYCEMAIVP